MHMVWELYRSMLYWNTISPEERFTKSLWYACRSGFKTLNAAIVELLSLTHDSRGSCHIAAGESHVKHCYNDYFQPYIKRNSLIWELVESSILEKTVTKKGAILETMPCTKKRVQGPHQSLVCKDEIDVVQDVSAYSDIDSIPINMPDGRPPITFGISVRKSAFGLVQKEIDEAPQKGVKVFHWNIIDIMERCPESRSGTKKIPIYVKRDTLISQSEEDFKSLPPDDQKRYERFDGYEGCLKNCKIFAACRTHSKKQKSKSKWLKTCDYVQMKLFESNDEQMAIAQFLCKQPPSTGLVYSDWRDYKNIKTYTQMYEIFTGESPDHEITEEELVKTFEDHSVFPIVGIDFGFTDPMVAYLIYVDGRQRVYIVKEIALMSPEMTDEEFALYFKQQWGRYKIETIYADTENPSGIKSLRKAGFHCAGPKRYGGNIQRGAKDGMKENVVKDVRPGISTVRNLIRIPGTENTRLFVHESCEYLKLCIHKFHHKLDSAGNVIDGEYAHEYSHAPDAIRYPLHSTLGIGTPEFNFAESHGNAQTRKFDKAPTPEEIGQLTGKPIYDNRADFEDNNDDDDDGGFNFAF